MGSQEKQVPIKSRRMAKRVATDDHVQPNKKLKQEDKREEQHYHLVVHAESFLIDRAGAFNFDPTQSQFFVTVRSELPQALQEHPILFLKQDYEKCLPGWLHNFWSFLGSNAAGWLEAILASALAAFATQVVNSEDAEVVNEEEI